MNPIFLCAALLLGVAASVSSKNIKEPPQSKPIFIDLSEEPAVPSVTLTIEDKRTIIKQAIDKPFVMDSDECENEDDPRLVVHLETTAAPVPPTSTPRMLHTIDIRRCEPVPEYRGENNSLLVLTENNRIISKVEILGSASIIKVFQWEPDGPNGVVVAGWGCFLCHGDTWFSANVYEIKDDGISSLRDLALVYSSDCGASGATGEKVAVFFLKNKKPFQLTQKNYTRTCDAFNKKEKSFKFLSNGAMKQ